MLPWMLTLPPVGCITPAISFSMVLFPAPLPPISATASPRRISKLTPFSAMKPENFSLRWRSFTKYSLMVSVFSCSMMKRMDTFLTSMTLSIDNLPVRCNR